MNLKKYISKLILKIKMEEENKPKETTADNVEIMGIALVIWGIISLIFKWGAIATICVGVGLFACGKLIAYGEKKYQYSSHIIKKRILKK